MDTKRLKDLLYFGALFLSGGIAWGTLNSRVDVLERANLSDAVPTLIQGFKDLHKEVDEIHEDVRELRDAARQRKAGFSR